MNQTHIVAAEERGGEDMDCCICSPMASVFRPPRNAICVTCYEGGRCMIDFLNKLEDEGYGSKPNSKPSSCKGISNAFKWMKEMKEVEEELNEKLGFLDSFMVAFRDGIHTDILIKPGNGPPIPAHRALLATRSEVFRTMLDSDECKAAAEDIISFEELNHEELQCLLEFLYCGSLPNEKAERHAYSLLIAADKYEIPFLKKFCENHILCALEPSNALNVLEISDVCSNETLKDSAMNSIFKHMEEIVFSDRYDEFALKNAHLCVDITRMLLLEMKDKKDACRI